MISAWKPPVVKDFSENPRFSFEAVLNYQNDKIYAKIQKMQNCYSKTWSLLSRGKAAKQYSFR